ILVPLVIISFSFFRGPETLKWILNLRKEKPEIGSWWHKGPWWFTSLTNKSKKEKNKPEINYEEFLEKIKATKDWELPLHKMEKKDLEALQKNSGLSDLDFNEFRKLCRKLKRTEERDKTEKQLQ
ncbi:hypothetical protein KKB11_05600, partial [Candidatus Micrarchaeota archaeon]|nr:hypothetical protein [Candidatus Micrarchaeota archaeon]